MTETEWLSCTDPKPMLTLLPEKLSERKRRLLAVACCRKVWQLLPDQACRAAVEMAEQFADGKANAQELAAARDAASWAPITSLSTLEAAQAALTVSATDAVYRDWDVATLDFASDAARFAVFDGDKAAASKEQAALIRDFGNPFSPAPDLSTSCLTPQVLSLAQLAYEHRMLPEGTLEPGRLGALAEGLEGAGCREAKLLEHLREAGPHVRGCWAVDLVLARK
jgi:hypothetical protein